MLQRFLLPAREEVSPSKIPDRRSGKRIQLIGLLDVANVGPQVSLDPCDLPQEVVGLGQVGIQLQRFSGFPLLQLEGVVRHERQFREHGMRFREVGTDPTSLLRRRFSLNDGLGPRDQSLLAELLVGPGQAGVRPGKCRVSLHGLLEIPQRLPDRDLFALPNKSFPLEEVEVGLHVLGFLQRRDRGMCRGKVARKCSDHLRRDVALHREHVVEGVIVLRRPNVLLGRDVDHLDGDPDSVRRLPDAPLNHRPNPELLSDLRDVLLLLLVFHDGRPRDYLQAADERETGDQFLGQAVSEVLVVRVRAHAHERKDGDSALVERGGTAVRGGVASTVHGNRTR